MQRTHLLRRLSVLTAALALGGQAAGAGGGWTYAPLEPGQIHELRAAIAEMKTNPRGPYLRIRWFCEDGTVLPPGSLACRDHGGGHQHAEMRPEIARLSAWGFHFGTILRTLSLEDLLDEANSGYRLHELVVQDFLERSDDGWIVRRARYYRGARQAEDELVRGRELLEGLLGDARWRRFNLLDASLLVAAIPHGQPGAPGARMRSLALEIARLDPGFEPLRVKIHSMPGPPDLAAARAYRERRGADLLPEVRALLDELVAEIETAYMVAIDLQRWRQLAGSVASTALAGRVHEVADALPEASPRGRIHLLAELLGEARTLLEGDLGDARSAGTRALAILDTARHASALLFAETTAWLSSAPVGPRSELLRTVIDLVTAAYGTGWLSRRELEALQEMAAPLLASGDSSITRAEYLRAVRYLAGAVDWGTAALQQRFGTVLERYAPVEPLALRFRDDVVRDSILLPLSALCQTLAADAAEALGVSHRIFESEVRTGVLALNPGFATGTLHVLDDAGRIEDLDPDGIYVLPETPADLGPVAGILTLEQASRLSHVQLLARELGIPNAAIAPALVPLLREHQGERVVYAVTAAGFVVLDDSPSPEPARPAAASEEPASLLAIDEDRLDLSVRELRRLEDVDVDDSGRIVGPKAANLGHLHGLFPDRVAPGLVIPFGVFRAHIDRDLDGDGRTLHEEIVALFRDERAELAAGEPPASVRARVLERLASIRNRIAAMTLLPGFRAELETMTADRFGPAGSYGVFVRSDTNVEDLAGFSGAGLNLTVMNVIGAGPLIQAIRDVWASPFRERSYLWRQRLLRNAEAVYPSVVLLQSVPSEASGVLVTADITGTADLAAHAEPAATWTVTVAEGVGGVVEGEAAETLLIPAEPGSERGPTLLSSARAVWRKVLGEGASGGMARLPARGDEPLLTPHRIDDLRVVVREIVRRYPRPGGRAGPPPIWDIEFGFIGDRTALFQIRPFVIAAGPSPPDAVAPLERRTLESASLPIDLSQPVIVGGQP